MNTQEMMRILDSIARDRNVEREALIEDLEAAMVAAARKHYNTLDASEFQCEVDRLTGEIRLYRHGQPLELSPEELGRIAAQTFKQVMIQKFREDERSSIYEEFSKRVGEIVTGTAQRYEGGAVVVQIDRAEGFMPRSEQIPGEQFQPGDRVRCLILDVRDTGSQVKIVLSRSSPDFIRKLFEVEVPEVAERVIEIKAIAREPGHRSKVAVASIDSKVDAVGACVGVRGSRIRNIVDELNGEKIDIVRWNDSSQVLIQNALKPAMVNEVSLCFELGRATVVVPEDQLSLAIGKRGQNVRLAAKLTGWDIDILTPAEFNKGLEIMAETLEPLEGVTEEMLDRLAAMGAVSVFDVEEIGAEVLAQELQCDMAVAQAMVAAASERAKEVAEQQQREKEEAERKRAEEQAITERLLRGDDVDSQDATAPPMVDTPPEVFERLASDESQNPEAELSGGEAVSHWPPPSTDAAEDPIPPGEPEPGYDPEDAASAPVDSDADEEEGEAVTDEAVHDVLRKGVHPESLTEGVVEPEIETASEQSSEVEER
ncbi:MAG: transcription termination/antitermination protein NusA [Planctomycetota bacterium]|nr:MAG: transcription termination/antitermination protein NusA [Planctomycetota bacterium]